MPPQALLERFVLRILEDIPNVDEPLTASGQAGGRIVEITIKPETWTGPALFAEPRLTPSERRIMDIVKEGMPPITGFGILGKLRASGRNYSMHTVYKSLARLVADGLLHNDRDGMGYTRISSS